MFDLHFVSLGHANLLLLFSLGAAAGTLNGFLGVGGGILAVPMLHLLGAPMPFAVGTSFAYITGASAFASLRNRMQKNIELRYAWIAAAVMIPSVEISARLLSHFSKTHPAGADTLVRAGLIALNIWIVISFLRPASRGHVQERKKYSIVFLILFSVLTGLISGMLGVGGGAILVPIFCLFLAIPLRRSVGTSSFVILITAAFATLSYALKHSVDFTAAALMIAGSALGATFGAAAVMKVKEKQIRLSFAVVSASTLFALFLKQAGFGKIALAVLTVSAAAVIISMSLTYFRSKSA